jgi:hypothetical protein
LATAVCRTGEGCHVRSDLGNQTPGCHPLDTGHRNPEGHRVSQFLVSLAELLQPGFERLDLGFEEAILAEHHTMGKSGRAMLDAIVSGEDSPERLAGLALGKLRSKIPQLQLALEGRIRDHHPFLLGHGAGKLDVGALRQLLASNKRLSTQ